MRFSLKIQSESNLHHAFTITELLIVLTIALILAAVALPMVGLAQRGAKRVATLAIQGKVDAGLRQFRTDVGAFPYYSVLDPPGNHLAWAIGSDLDPSTGGAVDKLRADIASATRQYAYAFTDTMGGEPTYDATAHVFRAADVPNTYTINGATGALSSPTKGNAKGTAVMLNRMAIERARRAILAGAVHHLYGVRIPDRRKPDGSLDEVGRDLSGQRVVAAPAEDATSPGWASDYLAGTIEARHRSGAAILDAWGRPLIYVGQVIPGATAAAGFYPFGGNQDWGPNVTINHVDPAQYGLGSAGRTTLRTGLPADGAALPDPADLRRSDRRTYAAPGHELACEVWSAGPDGRFAWLRSDLANRDNVIADDPDRSLR